MINKRMNGFGVLNSKYMEDHQAGKRLRGSCGGAVLPHKVGSPRVLLIWRQ